MKTVSVRIMLFYICESIYVVTLKKNIGKLIVWLKIKVFSLSFNGLKYGHRKKNAYIWCRSSHGSPYMCIENIEIIKLFYL